MCPKLMIIVHAALIACSTGSPALLWISSSIKISLTWIALNITTMAGAKRIFDHFTIKTSKNLSGLVAFRSNPATFNAKAKINTL